MPNEDRPQEEFGPENNRLDKDGPGDEEILWPKGEHGPQYDELLNLTKDLSDEKTKSQVEIIDKAIKKAEHIATNGNGDYGQVRDMPEGVLDGALGELCQRTMLIGNRFPIAYAWPALLAVASVFVPRYGPKQHLNLFVALSGPVHSGKTQAIEAAQQIMGIESPILMQMMAGSAEALVRKCKDAGGEPRLFSPDELGHLLEKSHIENASFPYVLNSAFYRNQFEVHMGRKEVATFNASLSILGGIVDSRFEDLFSHSTTAGLYDRFFFGACPSKFKFSYFPFEAEPRRRDPVVVSVHPDVWIQKDAWLLENEELEPRTAEIAIRSAIICAAFSRRSLLRAEDLGPAFELLKYEQRIRRYLRPNEGENPEAKIALKFMEYLKRLEGREITKRALFHNCGAERCGLTIAERALKSLHMNDDVYITPSKERPTRVRLVIDEGEE